MKLYQILFLAGVLSFISCKNESNQQGKPETKTKEEKKMSPAKTLVAKMVNKVGSMDKLKELHDVEYTYTYHDTENNLKDVSTERYIFEGEKSWAKYDHHKKSVMPDKEGTIVQAYDGNKVWTTLNGEMLKDPKSNKRADFLRKTNFYWFAMMPKLMDDGISYELMKDRMVNDKKYKVVKASYNENVGDVQDIYMLYIDPETNLVDQFLFTVMDFDVSDPLLMKVEYSEVEGLMLTTKRVYMQSDWDGNEKGEYWTEEISENIKFNNGFDDSLFNL